LQTITLPTSIKTIGDEAFSGTKLAGVNPEAFYNIESIGQNAFNSVSLLTTPLVFNKIQFIGSNAFYNAIKIPSITIELDSPEKLQTLVISNSAFAYATLMTGTLTLVEGTYQSNSFVGTNITVINAE